MTTPSEGMKARARQIAALKGEPQYLVEQPNSASPTGMVWGVYSLALVQERGLDAAWSTEDEDR